jgi:hypothetical protein
VGEASQLGWECIGHCGQKQGRGGPGWPAFGLWGRGGSGGLPSEKGAQGGHTGKGKAKLVDHEPGAEGAEDAEDAAAHVIHTVGVGSADLNRSDRIKAAAAAEGTDLSAGPLKALGERLGRKKVDFLRRKPSRGGVPQAPQEAPRQPPTSSAEASDRIASGSRRPLLLKPQNGAGPSSGLEAFGGTSGEARAAHHGSNMIQLLDGRLGAKVTFDLLPENLVDAFATKSHPVHSAARKVVAQAFDYLVQHDLDRVILTDWERWYVLQPMDGRPDMATVEGPFLRQDEDPTVMAMLCAVQDEVLQQPRARDSWQEQVDRLQEEQQVSSSTTT